MLGAKPSAGRKKNGIPMNTISRIFPTAWDVLNSTVQEVTRNILENRSNAIGISGR